MSECKSLQEWLEEYGNPKYAIAEGNYGTMVLVVESNNTLNPGITIYNYEERVLPNGSPYFWMSTGWGVPKESIPALKKYLSDDPADESEPPKEMKATVYLTVELGRMMKIHYMRNSTLPELDYALAYLYTTAGMNIDKDEYPEDLAAEVYENLVALKREGKEIW